MRGNLRRLHLEHMFFPRAPLSFLWWIAGCAHPFYFYIGFTGFCLHRPGDPRELTVLTTPIEVEAS